MGGVRVVELRQYTLHPGRRDTLVELFDRDLVETQEAAGMRVVGQFRDADDPDRFVWVRAFPDMETRGRALAAFYGGPVWKAHREAANATMIDSDDVLLLQPVGAGFPVSPRPPVGVTERPRSVVVATICHRASPFNEDFLAFFDREIVPVLTKTSAAPIACFQTLYAENNFPALPVRTGENVFVWFSSFADRAQYDAHTARLARSESWTELVRPKLLSYLSAAPEELRLAPTARSALR